MERRGFLKALIGGVAVAAAARTFPFRVFSFPTDIKIPNKLKIYPDLLHVFENGDRMIISMNRDYNGEYLIMEQIKGDKGWMVIRKVPFGDAWKMEENTFKRG